MKRKQVKTKNNNKNNKPNPNPHKKQKTTSNTIQSLSNAKTNQIKTTNKCPAPKIKINKQTKKHKQHKTISKTIIQSNPKTTVPDKNNKKTTTNNNLSQKNTNSTKSHTPPKIYTANENKSTYKTSLNIKSNQIINIIEINIKGGYNKPKIKEIQHWIKPNKKFDIITLTEVWCTSEEFAILPKIHKNYKQTFIGHSTSEAQNEYIENRKIKINNNLVLTQEQKLAETCKINKKIAGIKDRIILIKNNIKHQFQKRHIIQSVQGLSLE